ncbi:Hypothetical protein AA314_04907 [Archangium gephyra]|uniref:Uncharacterized protein n=1 Tax=Archangium gephyra TaxID=48 RepID=A0AAC8Q992_9BACT|nr:Hypothetical protein AA314_04907 [Archangium gephyra]
MGRSGRTIQQGGCQSALPSSRGATEGVRPGGRPSRRARFPEVGHVIPFPVGARRVNRSAPEGLLN